MSDLAADPDLAAILGDQAVSGVQPQALAFAGGLVVKSGVNSLSSTSGGMPQPLSLKLT